MEIKTALGREYGMVHLGKGKQPAFLKSANIVIIFVFIVGILPTSLSIITIVLRVKVMIMQH